MKFSTGTKKTIDRLAPVAAAALAGWYTWRRKGDAKETALTAAIALVVAYIITTQLTRLALNTSERPDRINVPPDAAGIIDTTYDPAGVTRRLRNDVYGFFGYLNRDKDTYAELAALSNANLMKVYNYWNENYFSEHGETMVQAMRKEIYGNGWTNDIPAQVNTIIARLEGMGAK